MKRFRLAHHLKTRMWFVPLLFILGGVIFSLVISAIDDGHLIPLSVSGDPHAALQILYLIAFSMLTLTGLVLSLVVVVVQLAMGVFSPRIVRQILQDRPSQSAIGLFAGTFAFAILMMRDVRTTANGGSVPGLGLIVAVALVIACIITLLWYLDHIGQSLRVAALVEWVAEDALKTLDRVCPDSGEGTDHDPAAVVTPKSGVLFKVEHERLVGLAERADCILELVWSLGDYVPMGAVLVRVAGDPSGLSHADVVKTVALGPERTLNQDAAYGIRMLVDIAERSLSSGPFSDPTTAVQAIDRLHDLMRQLARRTLHTGEYHDASGRLRLTAPTLLWDGYVRLAFDEVRQAGADSPQVTRRLRSTLDDLLTVAPTDRRPALEHQLAMLEDGAAVAGSAHDRHEALVPDPSGLGSAADLVTSWDGREPSGTSE